MTDFPAVPVANLASALALRSQSLSSGGTGFPFIKLTQAGDWIYGADDTDVQEGSHWAVNPQSFAEGYIAWGVGEVIDERMALMTSAQPIVQNDLPAVPKAEKGWQRQVGFMMVCLNGDDKGTQVMFKSSSAGGVKGVRALIDAVVTQIAIDPTKIMPAVVLEESHYVHKDWGKTIYNPVFNVQSWMAVDSTEAPAVIDAPAGVSAPAEPPSEEPAAPVRKRRRPAAKA
jgi:hypothetical protein